MIYDVTQYIKSKVHELYWNQDMNCAGVTLTCLSELYQIPLEKQTITAAIGLHGAGGYRAQCGLVEGGLMFIGIYGDFAGMSKQEIVQACFEYGKAFEEKFSSLRCRELRPSGFSETDPPHMCEGITCVAIAFTYEYVKSLQVRECHTGTDLGSHDLIHNGKALVNEVKEKLQDKNYSFDLTSRMHLKSESREIEKYIKIISSGKAKEKDVKHLEVLTIRLRSTMDGLMKYHMR